MLRQALRRVLWLAPTLVVITIAAFWMLAPMVSPGSPTHALPRFVNLSPEDVASLSGRLVDRVARPEGDRDAARALAELGGAALPHVLPRLDALDPKARTRVALALAPICERMNLTRERDHADPDTAALFWSRFWQDRSIDFRPVVVRRAVRRFTDRPSALRAAEVVAFDTYALPDLIGALRLAVASRDMAAIGRLGAILGRLVSVPPNGVATAEPLETGMIWLAWWNDHAHRYVAFQGAARVFAMLSETQYGRLVMGIAGGTVGLSPEQRTSLATRSRTTGALVLCALLAGWGVGIAWAALSGVWARRGRLLRSLAVAIAAVPSTMAAQLVAPAAASALLAAALMAISFAALVALHESFSAGDLALRSADPSRRASGMRPARIALRAARASGASLAARAGSDFPILVTAAFVFERAFDLDGLGEPAIAAIEHANLPELMVLVVASTVSVALVQLAGDQLRAVLDPRLAAENRGVSP